MAKRANNEKRVREYLLNNKNENGEITFSHKELSKTLGVNESTISNCILSMKKDNQIKQLYRGNAYNPKSTYCITVNSKNNVIQKNNRLNTIQTSIYESIRDGFSYMDVITKECDEAKKQSAKLKYELNERQMELESVKKQLDSKSIQLQNMVLMANNFIKDIIKIAEVK